MPRPILFLLTRAYGQLANQRLLLGARPLPATYLRVFGVTKNSSGVAIGYCAVHLFRASDDVEVDQVISDAAGNYEFRSASLTTTYYVVAYKASGYRAAVLATVPAGYWRFGESSGTLVLDEMGTQNGIYVDTPTLGTAGLLTGDLATSVTLNGTTQEMVIADNAAWSPSTTGKLTVAFWYTPTSSTTRYLAGKNSAAWEWCIAQVNDDATHVHLFAQAFASGGGNLGIKQSSTLYATNVPCFVVVEWDVAVAGSISISTNGDALQSGAMDLSTMSNTTSFVTFGERGDLTGWLEGRIQEAAIWTRALSAAEIAALYVAGTTVTTDLSGTTVNTLVGS